MATTTRPTPAEDGEYLRGFRVGVGAADDAIARLMADLEDSRRERDELAEQCQSYQAMPAYDAGYEMGAQASRREAERLRAHLRYAPFATDEVVAAINRHEAAACEGACLAAAAGREILRLRREAPSTGSGQAQRLEEIRRRER